MTNHTIATVTLRIADLTKFRLFVWELRRLEEDMRVGASPFVERLEHLIDRMVAEGEDEGGEA